MKSILYLIFLSIPYFSQTGKIPVPQIPTNDERYCYVPNASVQCKPCGLVREEFCNKHAIFVDKPASPCDCQEVCLCNDGFIRQSWDFYASPCIPIGECPKENEKNAGI